MKLEPARNWQTATLPDLGLRRVGRIWGAGHPSGFCWLVMLGSVLMLIVLFLDAPTHRLTRALDPTQRDAMRAITRFGNSAWPLVPGLVVLGLVAARLRGTCGRHRAALLHLRRCTLFFVGAVAVSGLVASALKHVIGRARPSAPDVLGALDFAPMAFLSSHASFPSGHATTAMAMMLALALLFPRYGAGLVLIGLWLGLSRALVGVHWLSDVVAGILLGAALTLALHRRMFPADLPVPVVTRGLWRIGLLDMARGTRAGGAALGVLRRRAGAIVRRLSQAMSMTARRIQN